MSTPTDGDRLPESIGMCLSGGGFRAAAFHLGAMAYLSRVGLLSRVQELSTVSGGTITGAKYVLSLVEGRPFSEFFRKYYHDLQHQTDPNLDPLIKTGLRYLGSGEPTNTPSGRRNLITSMAQTYTEKLFFNDAEQRPYLFEDILQGDTRPLNEITFNATDFRTGIAFRFQKSQVGWIGNYYTRLPREAAGKMRLGDIVAASSCFPGGFEPLEFPHDFGWPDNELPAEIREQMAGKPLGLMDGGVYDNQGIDSLMLADHRTDPHQQHVAHEASKLHLFIMSDADRTSDDLFPYPLPVRETKNRVLQLLLRWNPSLRTINALARGLEALCLITIVMVAAEVMRSGIHWTAEWALWATVAHGVPMLLALCTAFLVWSTRHQVRTVLLPQIPVVGFAGYNDLKRLRLDQIIDMLNLRARSLLALTSEVFMKRIRQLGYRVIYDDERYDGKRLANFVYQLKPGGDWYFDNAPKLRNLSPALREQLQRVKRPGPKLGEVAEYAEKMETTLWFTNRCELPALVASGQATICFNLMKHVVENHRFDDESRTFVGEAEAFWGRLVTDWEQFVEEPYKLLEADLNQQDLPAPSECADR